MTLLLTRRDVAELLPIEERAVRARRGVEIDLAT